MTTLTADFTPESLAALAKADVARALLEDVATGDLTASLIDPSKRTTARILARALNYKTADIDRPSVDLSVLGEHCLSIM